jgi:outer membrane receptor protein involved in Fe transport
MPDYTSRLVNETAGDAPITETFSDNFLDPTITLRYRLNDDHSLFARFAEAAKAAGYDTGQTTIPTDIDEMRFENELGRTFEIGSKGNLWDSRVRYDVTLFRTDFIDLQLSGLAPLTQEDQTSVSLNAGKQRVQGLEFAFQAAATDNLTLGLSGALMDGEMVEFDGSSCNATELYNTLKDVSTNALYANYQPLTDVIPCTLTTPTGATYSRLDRSGTEAPRTPDYKFVGDVRYVLPVFDSYELVFIGKGYVSDGYITARDSFESTVKYNKHGDLNLQLGFGPQDGTWKLATYANNIFEARESYNAQYDVNPDGLAVSQVTRSNFMTYGVKFNYNFGE